MASGEPGLAVSTLKASCSALLMGVDVGEDVVLPRQSEGAVRALVGLLYFGGG
jgi:hypothetical protein